MNIFKKFIIANLMLWAIMEKKPLTLILTVLYYPLILGIIIESMELAEGLLITGELDGTIKG